ncbi:MAG: hypothetical protein JNJ58_13130 [Chitinophagaceae bacterium]|nr:hypothetical protein [Chitinophagaceae bacterium]
MKKVILSLSALGVLALFQSCGETTLDPAAVQAKVDSLASGKIKEAEALAIQECETRMATELKAVTDSLVNAAQMANAAQ